VHNLQVPRPVDVFTDFSDSELLRFAELTDNYYAHSDTTGRSLFFLLASHRVCFCVYSRGQPKLRHTFRYFADIGYKLCWSEHQITENFCKLTLSFRNIHIDKLFDQEYHYYAYL